MNETRIPRAVYEGVIDILGLKIRCVVLDDGTRVIPEEDMAKAIRFLFGDNSENE